MLETHKWVISAESRAVRRAESAFVTLTIDISNYPFALQGDTFCSVFFSGSKDVKHGIPRGQAG